ncbi:GAP family protein [uncultured Nocardioides sp.]|uniref:GAP family protein n=1 Tax=uncultured Nocardioides sp. TaxID=198441 RepID=UPI002610FB12|nr:GAP family protein [uncultured Nocardioides sp.]
MEHVLLGVLPLGLAAAVSPVMLTEQTVLMAGRGGTRRSWAYAVGALLVAAAYVGALVTLGRSVSLPTLPRVDGATDVLLGLLLVSVAVAVHRWPRRAPRPRTTRRTPHRGAAGAFAFGAFSMVTDVTSLALTAAAAKDVVSARLGGGGTVVLAALLVLLLALPAWLPPTLAAAAPRPAARVLGAVEGVFRRHSRRILVVLAAAGGVFLVLRGLVRLVTG